MSRNKPYPRIWTRVESGHLPHRRRDHGSGPQDDGGRTTARAGHRTRSVSPPHPIRDNDHVSPCPGRARPALGGPIVGERSPPGRPPPPTTLNAPTLNVRTGP